MKELLWINACMRGEGISRTDGLCRAFLAAFQERHPDWIITQRDLSAGDVPILNGKLNEERDGAARGEDWDSPLLERAKEFARADRVVIGAPYWDLSFPAALKAHLEWVSTLGVTFRYTDTGASEGLSRGEKLLYITTGGGPVAGQNFGYDYVKALSTMLGIPETACVAAEELDVWGGPGEENLQKAREQLEKLAQEW